MNAITKGTFQALGNRRLMVYGLGASAALAGLGLAALVLAPTAPRAADAAAPGAKTPQVTFEALPSGVKRITLSAKAAERLGIATGKVSEQTVIRRQMVGGLVVPPLDPAAMQQPGGPKGLFGGAPQAPAASAKIAASPAPGKTPAVGFGAFGGAGGSAAGFAGGAAAPSALKTVAAPMAPPQPLAAIKGDVWVSISLSAAEWERTAKDKPVRLLPLGTRAALPGELLAQPSGLAPVEDPKRSMLSVYYIVAGQDHGLALNNRMRVELPMVGVEDKQKVVPYSSIYYDGKGTPWVYVTSKPLVYERQRVVVERVAGDLAVLSEGPEVGTAVVSVGASMLFGTEIFGK